MDVQEPREAEFARPWQVGEPWPRQHVFPFRHQPHAEVYLNGTWCQASVTMRQEHADGRLVYHLTTYLPGATSPVHRAVIWHPGSIRPRA